MKIVRFTVDKKTRYGVLNGKFIQCIEGKPYREIKTIEEYYPLSEVKLLSPCRPAKIVELGVNYRAYAEENNIQIPNAPPIFFKPLTSVIGRKALVITDEKLFRCASAGRCRAPRKMARGV